MSGKDDLRTDTNPAGAPDAGNAALVEDGVLNAVELAMIRIRRRQSRRSLARPALRGMTEPLDLNTLSVIDAVDEGRSESERDVTVGFVADRLAIDPSRASRIVADAVRSGFVRRVASQEDGRRSCLALTRSGREAVSAAHRTRQDFYARALKDWDPEEQLQFSRLLTRFVDSLNDTPRD
ncbi:MarR family winged helix-turn-helix transcriptional regulator [Streptomyces turgidiscabies]|uniref:Transcriptional regulator, MarR family n=1 Tax=Streptomyces turgidiscabies (strain Car8) TaxID=698760 RepID=L7FE19_STRT8|nr:MULTISPECIES: MarR family transcriptional regulator [Streptomyces]ELP69454.1 transcriptional regulator, MarR family [Streptomyces turgidiscabies Car8]MDX3494389.1 MarR family transcriptional regulator [Streptomyces turgidiscabies]